MTLPIYEKDDDDALSRINKYVESPYEAAQQEELKRLKAAEDKLRKVHGDNPKPFASTCAVVSRAVAPYV